MKFSIGDKILLKQTGEEGVVINILSKDMLEVEVNGVEFPMYIDDVDHPYLKWFTEKNKAQKKKLFSGQLPVEKETTRTKRLPKGIYLSFIPVFKTEEMEDIVSYLKIYLINETSVSIRFNYDVRLLHQSEFRHEGALHAFGHLYLHDVSYEAMNDQPRFHWRLSDADHDNFKMEEGIVRIKPLKLFGHINELLLKNGASFSYLLIEDFTEKQKGEKNENLPPVVVENKQSVKKPKVTSFADLPRYEVDLHIEKIFSNYKKLSNAEIMDIQIRTLQRYLDIAIMHRQERMIIIHGLGTGALKDAVHKVLKEMPEVKRYVNEWIGNYGFGATEVIFRY